MLLSLVSGDPYLINGESQFLPRISVCSHLHFIVLIGKLNLKQVSTVWFSRGKSQAIFITS